MPVLSHRLEVACAIDWHLTVMEAPKSTRSSGVLTSDISQLVIPGPRSGTRNPEIRIAKSLDGRSSKRFCAAFGRSSKRSCVAFGRSSKRSCVAFSGFCLAGSPGMTAFGPPPARRLSFVTNQERR